jgi:prephenate dehydrogenase
MNETTDRIIQTDELTSKRVAIIGLGLMGGSLAMALQGRCAALLGVDPNKETLARALEQGIVEQASSDPREILPQADLVILAAPVAAIVQLLKDLPHLHPGSAIVMDLGSTKAKILEAMAELPERFDPLGGHPMCGKEKNSLLHAEAGLFQGAAFALTALERSSSRARRLATQLVRAIGAMPLWLDPALHDYWTARTSHFPYLVACMLASNTPLAAAELLGPGFRSSTRLAATSPAIMLDIVMTNRDELLAAVADFRSSLNRLEDSLLHINTVDLEQMLFEAKMWHSLLLAKAPPGTGR